MTRIACLLATTGAATEPSAQRTLLQVALSHSPRVEDPGAGLVYLDAAGLQGLFGDDSRLAARLRDVAAAAGLTVRVGIAGSRLGALAAARMGSGAAVVEPGRDAAYLVAAPLSLLPLSPELAARISRWGLRTLGELAALPTAGLFERLGGEGIRLQRLARGDDPRPLASWKPVPLFEESMECEWGLDTLEPVVEGLGGLAMRLCTRLGARGLAADGFEWRCRLDGARVHDGALAPAVPMTDGVAVGGLLRLALEARPPRGIVRALTLRARPVRITATQESLVDRSRSSPRVLAATMNRLVALVGPDGCRAAPGRPGHPDPPARQPSPRRRGPGRLCAVFRLLFLASPEREPGEGRAATAPPTRRGRGHARLRPPGGPAIEPAHRAHRGGGGALAVLG